MQPPPGGEEDQAEAFAKGGNSDEYSKVFASWFLMVYCLLVVYILPELLELGYCQTSLVSYDKSHLKTVSPAGTAHTNHETFSNLN
jgi:hypothetical protein